MGMEERKPQYEIGFQFIGKRDKHKRVQTIIDIHTTRDINGDLVKIVYVTEHDFSGQMVRNYEVLESEITLSSMKP